jgi:hypothetical protein
MFNQLLAADMDGPCRNPEVTGDHSPRLLTPRRARARLRVRFYFSETA